jgi:hypothetical protein
VEWYEAPELDAALWRDGAGRRDADPKDGALWPDRPQKSWPGRRGKSPSREWTERKWREFYPFAEGEYSFEVKETAVWREMESRKKRRR